MKIAITCPFCDQISPDDFVKSHVTGVFDESSTVKDILEWKDKTNLGLDLGAAIITIIKEEKK